MIIDAKFQNMDSTPEHPCLFRTGCILRERRMVDSDLVYSIRIDDRIIVSLTKL